MEKIPWSLKQETVLFFEKPKLNHHYILHSCIYLAFHAPCIFEDGWADHYEEQWGSQKAVIAFTEQLIRKKMQHAPGGFTRYHVGYATHSRIHTHTHSRIWSNPTRAHCRVGLTETQRETVSKLKYWGVRMSESMVGWGSKVKGGGGR